MLQRVVTANPPMFAEIDAVFHIAGRPVLFSWGDVVYNPMSAEFPPCLVWHEAVHGARQLAYRGGTVAWWTRYLVDPQFRYDEELPAHAAEYRWFATNKPGAKRDALWRIARRLCGPLYGNIVPYSQAKAAIAAAA